MGETIDPRNNPILIQARFNGVKIFELVDPKIKKILGKKYPLSPSVNIDKLKKIIK